MESKDTKDTKDTQCYKCRNYGHIAANCTGGKGGVMQSGLADRGDRVVIEIEISLVITAKRRGTFQETVLQARLPGRKAAITVATVAISQEIANVRE
jgi:hypothetical protein